MSFIFHFSVPPKRVIIRQGHYAENFYFILAGQGMLILASSQFMYNTYNSVWHQMYYLNANVFEGGNHICKQDM